MLLSRRIMKCTYDLEIPWHTNFKIVMPYMPSQTLKHGQRCIKQNYIFTNLCCPKSGPMRTTWEKEIVKFVFLLSLAVV